MTDSLDRYPPIAADLREHIRHCRALLEDGKYDEALTALDKALKPIVYYQVNDGEWKQMDAEHQR